MCNGTDLGPNVKMWDCKNTSWEQRLREPTEFRAAAAALQFICNAFCNRCADNYCCGNISATTRWQEGDSKSESFKNFCSICCLNWYHVPHDELNSPKSFRTFWSKCLKIRPWMPVFKHPMHGFIAPLEVLPWKKTKSEQKSKLWLK